MCRHISAGMGLASKVLPPCGNDLLPQFGNVFHPAGGASEQSPPLPVAARLQRVCVGVCVCVCVWVRMRVHMHSIRIARAI